MTINANAAGLNDVAVSVAAKNPEASATLGFFAIVALVLVAMVGAFALFGLGGVGAVAIAEAAAMLVVCLFLTRG